MKMSQLTDFPRSPSRASLLERLRDYWGGRRGLVALGGLALVAGVGLNWGWLTAVGVTPILLAILPCAAMCALGLCMPGMMRKPSGAPDAVRDITLQATNTAPRLQLASARALPDLPNVSRHPATESVSAEQSCCHPSGTKESPNAKDN